jgi:hypothetical protein
MVVFAVLNAERTKMTGLLQEVPAAAPAVGDTVKPLSVARRPLAIFMEEPNSA